MPQWTSHTVKQRAARIRLLGLDVDGVLTDGRLYLGDNGVEYKAFFTRDGHGLKLLMACGVDVAVITGRSSQLVVDRMVSLGVSRLYQGVEDKRAVMQDLIKQLGIAADEAAYVGDDVLDIPAMSICGLAVAVADADPRVRQRAHWTTHLSGGRGAVREVCELIVDAQKGIDAALAEWLDG